MSTGSSSAKTPGGQLQPRDDNFDDPSNRYSGVGAVGMGFLTGDIDDEDEDEELFSKPASHPPGLTPHGRPGPAVVNTNAISNFVPRKPDPIRAPGRELARNAPAPIQVSFPNPAQASMRAPPPGILNLPQARTPPSPHAPMTPHPLQPPKTPIMPAFARPRLRTETSDVKFSPDVILRGNKEETLLSRNTPKGAEFWRRFSVVVKEDERHPGRFFKSAWLTDHQARSFKLNLCVWIVGLCLVGAIAGGGVLIWFLTSHNSVTNPKALDGNAGEGVANVTSSVVPTTTTAFQIHTVTGDLPPTVLPTIPPDEAAPTAAPVPDPAAIQKRASKRAAVLQSHRRHIRRAAN